jgi:hypothetical protein
MRTFPMTFGAALLACMGSIAPAMATNVSPSFVDAPVGWSVDRYAPDSFSDIGTFAGRADVLAIGIGASGNFANRPGAFQSTFNDTQGMSHPISGGTGSTLSKDLYVDPAWATASNGFRRTDMWGVVTDAFGVVVDYTIIGYTNNDQNNQGFAGFRVYDDHTGLWHDLIDTAVNYGAWNSLAITFTDNGFIFDVNGVQVADRAADPTASSFSSVIMQAYNCNDPSITGLVCNAYTADWAVPEPATLPLILGGLGLVALLRRRSVTARL